MCCEISACCAGTTRQQKWAAQLHVVLTAEHWSHHTCCNYIMTVLQESTQLMMNVWMEACNVLNDSDYWTDVVARNSCETGVDVLFHCQLRIMHYPGRKHTPVKWRNHASRHLDVSIVLQLLQRAQSNELSALNFMTVQRHPAVSVLLMQSTLAMHHWLIGVFVCVFLELMSTPTVLHHKCGTSTFVWYGFIDQIGRLLCWWIISCELLFWKCW